MTLNCECCYGHFDCATVDGGPCDNELASKYNQAEVERRHRQAARKEYEYVRRQILIYGA